MVLATLLLACDPGLSPMQPVPALECSYVVTPQDWSDSFEGQTHSERRDALLGTQNFLNQNPDELWQELALVLSPSERAPVLLEWSGADCPQTELRLPLDGIYQVWGADDSPCAVVLDELGMLRCAGGVQDDPELQAAILEILDAVGQAYFLSPPLIFEWDTQGEQARAELWTRTTADMLEYSDAIIAFEDLLHQSQ